MATITKKDFEGELKYYADVIVEKDEYQDFKDRITEQVLKNVEVPGFRKGKAPRAKMLEKINPMALNQTILQETVQKFSVEAVEEMRKDLEKENRIAITHEVSPEADLTKELEDGSFQFRVFSRLLPKVDLESLKDIKKKGFTEKDIQGRPEISDFVDQEKSKILNGYNKFEDSDKAAEEGDQVVLDMAGTVDGKEDPKLAAKDTPIVIGSKQFLADFEEGVKGIKKGEEKEFEVKFPESYFEPTLAGKIVTFKVNAKVVKTPEFKDLNEIIKNNEQLTKQFEDEAGFEKYVKEFFETETAKRIRQLEEKHVLEQVIETIPDFALEEEPISAEVDRITNKLVETAGAKGITPGEAYIETKLPGFEDSKIKSYDAIKIKELVEKYVRNEFKLSAILSFIYRTKVEDKPNEQQLESTVKEVSANPQKFGIDPNTNPNDISNIVVDRIVRQLSAQWLFNQYLK